MAQVWKKLQRSDSDYTGDVTGTVDGTAAATVKGGAVKANLGLNSSGIVQLTLPVDKGGTGLTNFSDANYKNSNVTHSDVGTTKANIGLGSVLDQAQVTTFAQDGIPTSLAIGDIWIDTNDNHKTYRAASIGADAITAGEWILTTLGKGALGLVKGDVGLGNVDNTTDALKPVSTAQGTAIGLKANKASPTFTGTVSGISKTMVGLGNVTNESKATMFTSPAFTGTPTGVSKTHVGLGNVANESKATMFADPTFTGSVSGVSKSHVGLGNVSNVTAVTTFAQDAIPTALAAGDIWTDTNDDNTMYRAVAAGADEIAAGEWVEIGIQKGSLGLAKADVGLGNVDNTTDANKAISTAQAAVNLLKAPLANPAFTGTPTGITKSHVGLANVTNESKATMFTAPTFTGTVAGVTKAHVGLTNVIDQAITVSGGALKFGATTQTLDEDTVSNSAALGGSTLAQTKAAAVSTAETNIVGASPGVLDTLTKIKTALNNDASFNSTIVNSIATKGKAPMALTAEDTDGDASYTNDPASEVLGQIGIYNGQQYVVVDI